MEQVRHPDVDLVRLADRTALALVTARHADETDLVGMVLAGLLEEQGNSRTGEYPLVHLVLHILVVRTAHIVQDTSGGGVLEEAALFASLACNKESSETALIQGQSLVEDYLQQGEKALMANILTMLQLAQEGNVSDYIMALTSILHAALVVAACRVHGSVPGHLKRWGITVAQ